MSTEKRIHERDVIIETIARLMIPFIQLYGLYVMVGTEGAGGGFQGGTILAASFILLVVAFGLDKGREKMPEGWNALFKSLGLYLYAGVGGLLCIILSLGAAEYLNYSAIPLAKIIGGPATRGFWVANVVEVGIGITVMGAFVSIFYDLVRREESVEGGGAEK
ncbi:MAG: MnhB domain-containing protein [Candidatus Methanospirareceae archaeon]